MKSKDIKQMVLGTVLIAAIVLVVIFVPRTADNTPSTSLDALDAMTEEDNQNDQDQVQTEESQPIEEYAYITDILQDGDAIMVEMDFLSVIDCEADLTMDQAATCEGASYSGNFPLENVNPRLRTFDITDAQISLNSASRGSVSGIEFYDILSSLKETGAGNEYGMMYVRGTDRTFGRAHFGSLFKITRNKKSAITLEQIYQA